MSVAPPPIYCSTCCDSQSCGITVMPSPIPFSLSLLHASSFLCLYWPGVIWLLVSRRAAVRSDSKWPFSKVLTPVVDTAVIYLLPLTAFFILLTMLFFRIIRVTSGGQGRFLYLHASDSRGITFWGYPSIWLSLLLNAISQECLEDNSSKLCSKSFTFSFHF